MGTAPSKARLGADPDALERLATAVDRFESWGNAVVPHLRGVSTRWSGPDAERFRSRFDAQCRSIAGLSERTREAAASLRRSAVQQRAASAVQQRAASAASDSGAWTPPGWPTAPAAATAPAAVTERSRWAIQVDAAGAFVGGRAELIAETVTRSDGSASLHLSSSADGLVGLIAADLAAVGVGATVESGLTVDFESGDEMEAFLRGLPTALVSAPVDVGRDALKSALSDPVGVVADALGGGLLVVPAELGTAIVEAEAAAVAEHLRDHGATLASVSSGAGIDEAASVGPPAGSPQASASMQGDASQLVVWDAVSGEWAVEAESSFEALGQLFGFGASADVSASIRIPAGHGITPDLAAFDGDVEVQFEVGGAYSNAPAPSQQAVLDSLGLSAQLGALIDPAEWSGANLVVNLAVPAQSIRQVLSGGSDAINQLKATLSEVDVDIRVERIAEERFDVAAGVASVSVRNQEAQTIVNLSR